MAEADVVVPVLGTCGVARAFRGLYPAVCLTRVEVLAVGPS